MAGSALAETLWSWRRWIVVDVLGYADNGGSWHKFLPWWQINKGTSRSRRKKTRISDFPFIFKVQGGKWLTLSHSSFALPPVLASHPHLWLAMVNILSKGEKNEAKWEWATTGKVSPWPLSSPYIWCWSVHLACPTLATAHTEPSKGEVGNHDANTDNDSRRHLRRGSESLPPSFLWSCPSANLTMVACPHHWNIPPRHRCSPDKVVRSPPLSLLWPHLSASSQGSVIPIAVSDSLAAPFSRPAHHQGAVYSSLLPSLCCALFVTVLLFDCFQVCSCIASCTSFTNQQTSLADSPLAYHVQNLSTHVLHASKALYQHQGWRYPWPRPIRTHRKGRKREWMRSSTTTANESGTWTEGEGKWSIIWNLPAKESCAIAIYENENEGCVNVMYETGPICLTSIHDVVAIHLNVYTEPEYNQF